MKKSTIIICLLLMFIPFTSCAHNGDKSTQTDKSKYKNDIKTDYGNLREKYKNWFNDSGEIVYPYSIESPEYKTAKTNEERVELFDIPEEIIAHTSTSDIINLFEKYPLFDGTVYNDVDTMIDYYSNTTNMINELLKRENHAREAYDWILTNKGSITGETVEDNVDKKFYMLRFYEGIVQSKQGYKSFDKDTKTKILNTFEDIDNELEKNKLYNDLIAITNYDSYKAVITYDKWKND